MQFSNSPEQFEILRAGTYTVNCTILSQGGLAPGGFNFDAKL